MKKPLFYVLIVSAFLTLFLSFLFLNICIPDGCEFKNVCSLGNCVGETLIQHLGERDFFGRATAGGFQKFLILLTIVQGVFLIVKGAYKYFEEYLKTKYKICCFLKFKWVDYLILLFSSGILNPKIY